MALTPRSFISVDVESEARKGQQFLKKLSLLVVLSMIHDKKGRLRSVILTGIADLTCFGWSVSQVESFALFFAI